jgi:hypothetical protein
MACFGRTPLLFKGVAQIACQNGGNYLGNVGQVDLRAGQQAVWDGRLVIGARNRCQPRHISGGPPRNSLRTNRHSRRGELNAEAAVTLSHRSPVNSSIPNGDLNSRSPSVCVATISVEIGDLGMTAVAGFPAPVRRMAVQFSSTPYRCVSYETTNVVHRGDSLGTGCNDSCGCQAEAACADFGGCLCCREELTGSWFGVRPHLADSGITFDADVVQIYQGTVHDGVRQTFRYAGHGDYLLGLDFEKIAGWRGFSLQLRDEHRFGQFLASDAGPIVPALHAASPMIETTDPPSPIVPVAAETIALLLRFRAPTPGLAGSAASALAAESVRLIAGLPRRLFIPSPNRTTTASTEGRLASLGHREGTG